MTQHRIYFTETHSGYIICDSEENVKLVRQALDDGIPLEDISSRFHVMGTSNTLAVIVNGTTS